MTIAFDAAGAVTLTSKPNTVVLGERVMLNQFTVPGTGEYDVAGIQCESHVLADASAHIVRLDDLIVAYAEGKSATFAKIEGITAAHILVLNLASDATAEQAKQAVKALEPGYLILRGAGATPELIGSLGIGQTVAAPLKTTMAGLPLEGTVLVNA